MLIRVSSAWDLCRYPHVDGRTESDSANFSQWKYRFRIVLRLRLSSLFCFHHQPHPVKVFVNCKDFWKILASVESDSLWVVVVFEHCPPGHCVRVEARGGQPGPVTGNPGHLHTDHQQMSRVCTTVLCTAEKASLRTRIHSCGPESDESEMRPSAQARPRIYFPYPWARISRRARRQSHPAAWHRAPGTSWQGRRARCYMAWPATKPVMQSKRVRRPEARPPPLLPGTRGHQRSPSCHLRPRTICSAKSDQ